MYAKLFAQIYDGTLATDGPWQALVTFQQMLILADQDGQVDMTPAAISRRTSIPLEIIDEGLKALALPDPASRTPDEEGRRIVLLSDHRGWGWRVVNYKKYRQIQREVDRRDYHREYYQKNRAKQPPTEADSSGLNSTQQFQLTQPVQPIAEAEANTEAIKEAPPTAPPSRPARKRKEDVTFDAWLEQLAAIREKPIPEDDTVFAYAERIRLPVEFLRVAWVEFKKRYVGNDKKQKDWRQHFRNAVERNWYKLWWLEGDDSFVLTTAGKQAAKALEETRKGGSAATA